MESNPKRHAEKDDPRAIAWVKRYDRLKDERSIPETMWREIMEHFSPRNSNLFETFNSGREARLFDTTGQSCALQCAAGLLSWTTPANERWAGWEPARELRSSDRVKQWMQECSELGMEYYAKSNFYTERHEDLLTHCTVCTSAMFVSMNGNDTIFKSLAIGTYVIAENFLGIVDTLIREFELTADQAKGQFGVDKLGREVPLPEVIAECFRDNDGSKRDKKFTFLHVVEPRPKSERGDGVGLEADWQKAFRSVYIEKSTKSIVQEGGFDAFPFMVGRWLKAKFGTSESVWGYGPGFTALPEARQLNFKQKMLDVAIEKLVFPPVLVPDTLEGALNMSARGVTEYSQGIDSTSIIPLPLVDGNGLKWGMDRVEMRRKAIESAFHVDFFAMFRNTDPRITATQVNEMAGERLTMITPAFSRLVSEKDTPMLTRCFELWMERGMLPAPPEEAIQRVGNGFATPNPNVVYTSRLALAVNALRNVSFDRSFARLMGIAQIDPSVLDNIDMPEMVRDSMRNDGVPASWIRNLEKVEEMQAARAQAQRQANEMALIEQGSKAAANIGKPGVKELIGA